MTGESLSLQEAYRSCHCRGEGWGSKTPLPLHPHQGWCAGRSGSSRGQLGTNVKTGGWRTIGPGYLEHQGQLPPRKQILRDNPEPGNRKEEVKKISGWKFKRPHVKIGGGNPCLAMVGDPLPSRSWGYRWCLLLLREFSYSIAFFPPPDLLAKQLHRRKTYSFSFLFFNFPSILYTVPNSSIVNETTTFSTCRWLSHSFFLKKSYSISFKSGLGRIGFNQPSSER